jgi:hypothetical protein
MKEYAFRFIQNLIEMLRQTRGPEPGRRVNPSWDSPLLQPWGPMI